MTIALWTPGAKLLTEKEARTLYPSHTGTHGHSFVPDFHIFNASGVYDFRAVLLRHTVFGHSVISFVFGLKLYRLNRIRRRKLKSVKNVMLAESTEL